MSDMDIEKTVAPCKFLKMPYGLTIARATFQCLMEKVLKEFIGLNCLLYLDDIINFGNTFQKTLDNVMIIFCRFREYNLQLKATKCSLFQRKVNFLAHIISENGIECDHVKIEKIKDLQPPQSKTSVRAILGLRNYYRCFIRVFSSIIAPLQRVTHNDVDVSWGDPEQAALDTLKEAFCSAPILAYPDHEGEFIVDMDASNYTICTVLSQV